MKLKDITIITVLSFLLIMTGCAMTGGTTGNETIRAYKDLVKAENSGAGNITLTVHLYGSSQNEDTITQSTDDNATSSPDTSASLAKAGSTASAASGMAETLVKAVTNAFTPNDSTNNSKVNTETTKPIAPTFHKIEPTDNDNASVWKHNEVFVMQNLYHDGRPFYRLGRPGETFGKSILITDIKGNEFEIADTSIDSGDKANQFFFNGKGQVEHTFDGNASLFWYKNGSESVTIHYNGVN